MKNSFIKKVFFLINYYGFKELFQSSLSFLNLRYIYSNQRFFGKYTLRNKKNIYLGKNLKAYNDFFLEAHGKGLIHIGDGCIFNRNVYISSFSEIKIGTNCLFGPNIYIGDNDHGNYIGQVQSSPLENPVERKIFSKKIFIGNRVWVGNNVTITKGAHIGNGSIIGANSVVIGLIPENSMAVGSPAEIKKKYSFEKMKWINI